MKKIALILFVLIITNVVSAQITFENSYPNTDDGFWDKEFGLVNLGNSNYKYYFVDKGNSQITLYNLNHTVYKSITIPIGGTKYHIAYLSNSLFDCDTTDVEYMLTTSYINTATYTRIYDENGTLLFNENSSVSIECKPLCSGTITSFPKEVIFNTPNGTKMILGYTDGSTKIYGLCGTLSTVSIKDVNNLNESELQLFDAYPNPSSNNVRIDYNLPKDVDEGEILIFSIQGKLIKKYRVDQQFNHITISNNELSTGTYYYQLKTSLGITESKKMIKIQ
jgi:hypothetical protein